MSNSEDAPDEIEQRLKKILEGAFGGAPTPLKDVPTRYGEKRKAAAKKDQPPRKRRQRKKRAA
ncbi:MAG: hypothetical protein EPN75_03075 [Beijerinckiaceae bacterium]|nr:MAG: hypothetical protein EPN75_03075 [Beijerinckiaceae bacterium]